MRTREEIARERLEKMHHRAILAFGVAAAWAIILFCGAIYFLRAFGYMVLALFRTYPMAAYILMGVFALFVVGLCVAAFAYSVFLASKEMEGILAYKERRRRWQNK